MSQVHSLAKGLRVLEAFSPQQPELTLSEIVRLTDLDPGTVFRMGTTLVSLGYLDRSAGEKRFRLTLKVLDLGFNAIARSELPTLVRPILRSLVGTENEAANAGGPRWCGRRVPRACPPEARAPRGRRAGGLQAAGLRHDRGARDPGTPAA